MGDQQFWLGLRELDKELVKGSIRTEIFSFDGTRELDYSDGAEESFCKGMPTVVFGVKHPEAAIKGAKLLNRIFIGTGTEFVAEETHQNDATVYQIRSNIDQQHWEKLCVYCHYCFDREIKTPQFRTRLMKETQDKVTGYVSDFPEYTLQAQWKALEGVPAFITLMGLPGVLRPEKLPAPNLERKQAEFDAPSPRGTPLVFRGIQVHIRLKNKGDRAITESPYTYGFEPDKLALHDATDGRHYWELLLETFGSNPFEKNIGWTSRAIAFANLGFGSVGLYASAHTLAGWIGPATTIGTAGVFIVATYADHKWKILKKIEGIRKGSKELDELSREYAGPKGVARAIAEAANRGIHTTTIDPSEPPYYPNALVETIECLPSLNQWGGRIQNSRGPENNNNLQL